MASPMATDENSMVITTMHMRCLIVDDEPPALDLLENYISRVPFLTLAGKCANAIDAIHMLGTETPDVLFTDIQMPGLNGIQLINSGQLPANLPVILTTAYNEYAVEGFNLNVLDYLLKPISFERFFKAVLRAKQALQDAQTVTAPATDNGNNFIFIKSEYKSIKVNFSDILYIEGLKDYCKIYTQNGPLLTLRSMKEIEQLLPPKIFVRVHRSYIISIDKIKFVSKNAVVIGNNISLPVSSGFKNSLTSIIDKYQI